ncbi:MAG: DNA-directed DNA polymerase, partial [Methanoregulaceae archaeon]|nr:DNA-directed DNA polymerase [Methanoregulaceae archaeon]
MNSGPGAIPDKDRAQEDRPLRIAINQVEYSNTPGGPLIHVFGRDPARNAVHLKVTGFLPYFYVPADEMEGKVAPPQATVDTGRVYPSIHGVPLRRLYTTRPTDVRELRDRFHRHYEADIPFATRFMIDCGLTGGVAAPGDEAAYTDLSPATVDAPARVCIMDIECEDERGFPEPGRDAIICIGCWDSFDDRYTTFLWHAGPPPDFCAPKAAGGLANGCFSEDRHTICVYATEAEMIRGLAEYFRTTDPDIVSGWNFADFDMPYLTRRMEVLGLSPTSLSRMEGQTERTAIRGRALFDLLQAYRRMQGVQAESYRLDAVAEAELGDKKVRFSGRMSDLWREQPALLVEYNFKDVELCVAIDEKNRIIEFFREIARYVGCPLDRTLNSSNVIDIFILRKASGKFVLPSKGFAAGEEFEGATVFDPSRGVKSNVIVMDLKSLYPMAMMTINASPETKDAAGEYRAPNGIRFRAAPDGLTRSIISELLRERDEKKSQRNRFPFGSPEYILYDTQQNVLKVIMNTYYGVSGYARFRLYDRDIGAAVTSVGRAIIEHTRTEIERNGYHVLYGDTDSCMIELPETGLAGTIATARD